MLVLGIARDAKREFEIIGLDPNAVARYGRRKLLRIHEHGAFEPASVAQLLDASDVFVDRKWKLQDERCQSKEELHLEEVVERNIPVYPVRNPRMNYLVLIVARCLAHEVVGAMNCGFRG